ncbi:MAG: 4'-phosphopantetheinyl transferase superfamily protein [Ruminococcaceae bacterium]|nr:4'-phosphopantetheinyl transferase superfamily protein [Oscillospiraceae bacterium]
MLTEKIKKIGASEFFGGDVLMIAAECTDEVKSELSDLLKKNISSLDSRLIGDFTIEKDERGKPYIKGECGYDHVSISHSEKLFTCAFSKKRAVGIDTEHIERNVSYDTITRLMSRYFTPAEREHLIAFSASAVFYTEEFLRMWTKKEAYVKMTGEGLSGLSSADSERLSGVRFITRETDDGKYLISLCLSEK